MKPPASFTARPPAALYQAIAQAAVQLDLAIPETPTLKAGGRQRVLGSGRVAAAHGISPDGAAPAPLPGLPSPALRPPSALPQAARQYRRMVRKGLMYAGAGTAVVLAGYLGYRWVAASKGSTKGSGSGGGGEALDPRWQA